MGIGDGDWGLGIGDWAQSPIPNPQSPIPNPPKIKQKLLFIIFLIFKIIFSTYVLLFYIF